MKTSLNHIFRTIWSDVLNTFVAVSELTSAKGKRSGACVPGAAALAGNMAHSKRYFKPIVIALACCYGISAQAALPTGATVVSGQASFATSGNTLIITNSPNTVLNWPGFSIGSGETVRFEQQSASSAVLNRVVGPDPSVLLGTLTSNGRVFLINPAGILVGQGARIDVAGLVASTLNLSNADFLAGRLNFGATPNAGAVQNYGNITTPDGGTVYLVAPQVENHGIITTPKGETILAAGDSVRLIDTGTPGVSVQITGSSNTSTNLGQIIADSGRIGMVGALVNNSGTLNANSLVSQGGKVFLRATGRTETSGTITADGATGGTVEILGNQVGVLDGASVSADGTQGGGTVLIGGDYQGKNAAVQNAQFTYVAATANISADATQNGNGGKVIVWADDTTRFYGNISAKGGANGGDGGFAETSGHNYLDFRGRADLRAPKGQAGSLLLDPTNITIDNTVDTPNPPPITAGVYSTAVGPATLTWATINTQLGMGSLSIQTNSVATGGAGDININAGTTLTGTGTLTLLANNNINIARAISITAAGDVNMVAGWNNTGMAVTSGTGNITFNGISSFTTTGNIWLSAGNSISQAAGDVITANVLSITGDANGGAKLPGGVSLSGVNMVNTLAADLATVGGGALTFNNGQALTIGAGTNGASGISAAGNTSAITITANGAITLNQNISSGGTVNIDSGTGTLSGTAAIVANTINLQSNGGTGHIGSNIGTISAAPLKTSSVGGAGNANISIGTTTGPGAVYLSHTGDATLTQVTTATNASADISATGSLTVPSINTGTADMKLSAGNLLTISGLAQLTGANITLAGNLINIATANPATINSGTGVIWIHASTAGRAIDLGAKAGLLNTLELSTAELNTLAGTGTLRIGDTTAGNLSLSGPVVATGFNTLTLESGGNVSQAAAANTISANKLAVKAKGFVALDMANNSVTALAGSITGTTGTHYFNFKNNGALRIDTVDGVKGISVPVPAGGYAGGIDGVIGLQAVGNITQTATGGLSGAAVWASSSTGFVDLTTATGGNATGVLAGSAYSGFSYISSNAIALRNVDIHSGISTSMTGDIVLVGNGFSNNLATPFTTSPLGRWLVYAPSPASVTMGGLVPGFQRYGATYTNYPPASVPIADGSGFIYASAAPATQPPASTILQVNPGTTGGLVVPPNLLTGGTTSTGGSGGTTTTSGVPGASIGGLPGQFAAPDTGVVPPPAGETSGSDSQNNGSGNDNSESAPSAKPENC